MRVRLTTVLGSTILCLLAGTAALAIIWTPYRPLAIDIRARLKPPSAAHWIGTDEFGRDVLSRTMAAASTSASIALLTVAVALLFGSAIGVVAGYRGGWTARTLMAVMDALLAFPGILLALAVIVVVGGSRWGIVVALGVAYTPQVARVVRSTVLSIRMRDYVDASRLSGNSGLYTVLRHVAPNCLGPVVVLGTAMLGWVLLAEASLSFLGLGVPPPAPSWGNMLAGSRAYMQTASWLELAPGVCIALSLLGVNLLGDALRDWLDPRMRPLQ